LQDHFKRGLEAIVGIADLAKVGMTFAELYATGHEVLIQRGFEHTRTTTITSNAGEKNFGHTVPWSDSGEVPSELPIEELSEKIRVARKFIHSAEQYSIPQTCAFTVESYFLDPGKPQLPNVFFHVIVTFDRGKKEILTNFDEIFKSVGMDYMHE
jgi:hypothetical protein